MKIFLVNNAKVTSGAEEHLIDLAIRLRNDGIVPVFLVSAGSLLEARVTKEGFTAHPVFTRTNKLAIPFRIARAIRAESPDVISVNRDHNIIPVMIGARLALPFLSRKPKMVAVFHTPSGRWYPGLKKFDGIIATSEYTGASFYKANPGIEGKTTIIHYGIDLPAVDPAVKLDRNRPRKYFTDRQFPIIGMVGELWKNQEELIEAARSMRESFPDITVALVGGYGEATIGALREKVAACGMEKNFIFTGRIDRKLIPDIFFDLDLSVSTYRHEGFGIVHIESLACYTPVVAYNSGGLVEIIRNGGGVLVDGVTEHFAGAVVKLLADDEERFRLGREGRKVVEELFLLETMGKNHVAFYRNLLAEG